MTNGSKKTQRYRDRHPWYSSLANARKRCNYPGHELYRRYGGRGIECHLTVEEVKSLWFRDGAGSMKKPSLDRKDNDGHCTFQNCEFIELEDNIRKMNSGRRMSLIPVDTNNRVRMHFATMRVTDFGFDERYGPEE